MPDISYIFRCLCGDVEVSMNRTWPCAQCGKGKTIIKNGAIADFRILNSDVKMGLQGLIPQIEKKVSKGISQFCYCGHAKNHHIPTNGRACSHQYYHNGEWVNCECFAFRSLN